MGKLIPLGEWLPDQAAFGNPGTVTVLNCVPRTPGSYGPFRGPLPYSSALPDRVQGSYGYRDGNGIVYNFAGTATGLYLQTTGHPDYADVSGPSAPYHTAAYPDGFWQMTSFGTRVIATNFNDPIQSFNAGIDSAFSDLAAAAPRARFLAVIKDFLMVGNTFDATDGEVPYRLWWPAINDPTNWPLPGSIPAIEVQSDFQDLQQTDLGAVNGLVGGHLSAADGAAICERGIYRIMYVGSPDIFSFVVAQGASGTDAPMSIVNRVIAQPGGLASSVIFYVGGDGFYAFDGTSTIGIGGQKVDRFFFNDLDPIYLRAIQGTYDPTLKLLLWFYHGQQNSGLYNRCIVYNWELGRWAPVDLTATPIEWVEGITYSPTGYTLDELDPFGNLETLPFSLDSRQWTDGNPVLAWFNSSHQQAFQSGDSLAATVETTEAQLFPGQRARVVTTRPIADGVLGSSIAVGRREKITDSVVYTVAIPPNLIGDCPQRTTGRYLRFQMQVPPAANYNHLQGIDVTAIKEGIR